MLNFKPSNPPGDSSSDYGVIKKLVEDTRDIVEAAIIMVERADRDRCLYTLQPAPTSLAEYPKFGGKDAQCFFTFEEKVRRCLKSNRVPRRDQAAELRKQLSGHPLKLVPESIQDVDVAFDALRTRYGDEERVLGLRVAELKKMGSLPERFKDQVTFYVDLEGKIQEILDLGAKGGHLGRLAYGQDIFNAVYNLLKDRQVLKLLAVPGDKYSRDKLENTKKKLGEFRADANALDMIVPGVGKEQNHDGSGSGWRSHVQSTDSSEEESELEDHDDSSEEESEPDHRDDDSEELSSDAADSKVAVSDAEMDEERAGIGDA